MADKNPGTGNGSSSRDVGMQRVRVGLSGLAAVFLLTLLAASVFSFLGQDDQHATTLANGMIVANSPDADDDSPKEPLAELGVAPGGNLPKPDANTPVVTIPAPPAPRVDAQGHVLTMPAGQAGAAPVPAPVPMVAQPAAAPARRAAPAH